MRIKHYRRNVLDESQGAVFYIELLSCLMTTVQNMHATIKSTSDAPVKDFEIPKYTAMTPDTKGPAVCPISIIEPSTPMAEPRPSILLRSAMNADVADVTTERLNPKRMLNTSRGTNEVNRENPPIQNAPINAP